MRFFSLFLLGMFLGQPAQAGSAAGYLSLVEGAVKVGGKQVRGPTPVQISQSVETGADGRCTLLLGKGTVIHLGPSSRIEVTQHLVDAAGDEKSAVDLQQGSTRSLIRSGGQRKRQFSIRARAAVMGVRGTHIYAEVPADPAQPQRFATFEGAAVVELARGAAQPVELKANEAISVVPSAPRADGPAEGARAAPGPGAAPAPAPALAPPVERLSPDESARIAAAVAPPPREIRTQAEMPRPLDRRSPDARLDEIFQRENPVRFRMPLDPVRDGLRAPVGINITAKRNL